MTDGQICCKPAISQNDELGLLCGKHEAEAWLEGYSVKLVVTPQEALHIDEQGS